MHIRVIEEQGDLMTAPSFRPLFTHQVFDNEKIYGYKGLRISLFSAASSMFTLFNVQWDEKLEDADDVHRAVSERLAPGFTTDFSEFCQARPTQKRSVAFVCVCVCVLDGT